MLVATGHSKDLDSVDAIEARYPSVLLKERVGADVPTLGFYTYGEICPLPGSATRYTHGTTFVTVLIGEDA